MFPLSVDGVVYAAQGDKVNAAIGFGAAAIGVVSDAGAAKVLGQAANAMARGKVAEKRVLQEIGEAKNLEKVAGKEGKSTPDFQNAKQVGEIKDTKRVTDSSQLRIQREAAQYSNREHAVITGESTKVSPSVERQSMDLPLNCT